MVAVKTLKKPFQSLISFGSYAQPNELGKTRNIDDYKLIELSSVFFNNTYL